jgi:hypothetical protein
VTLTNFGTETLTSAALGYFFDDLAAATYDWTGSLETSEGIELTLPGLPAVAGEHTFTCYASMPNGLEEGHAFNDTVTSNFIVNLEPAPPGLETESFEGETFPPEGWSLCSHIFHEWGRTTVASYFGTGSAVRGNYSDGWIGGRYNLDLPVVNIPAGYLAELNFDYAYARYPGNNLDSMLVMVSPDCGASWEVLFRKGGSLLATAPSTYDLFVPSLPVHWKVESLPLDGYAGDILIRFQSVCGWGNNLYLDDISVDLAIGTGENSPAPAFTVYPNPVTYELHVGGLPAGTEITLTDLAGKTLVREKTGGATIVLDLSVLPDGVYFLKTVLGTRKVVKI